MQSLTVFNLVDSTGKVLNQFDVRLANDTVELWLKVYMIDGSLSVPLLKQQVIQRLNDCNLVNVIAARLVRETRFDFHPQFLYFYVNYLESEMRRSTNNTTTVFITAQKWQPADWVDLQITIDNDILQILVDYLKGYLQQKPYFTALIKLIKQQNTLSDSNNTLQPVNNQSITTTNNTTLTNTAVNDSTINENSAVNETNNDNHIINNTLQFYFNIKDIIQDDFLYYEAIRHLLGFENLDAAAFDDFDSLIAPYSFINNTKYIQSLLLTYLQNNNLNLEIILPKLQLLLQLLSNDQTANEIYSDFYKLLFISYLIFIYSILCAAFSTTNTYNFINNEFLFKDVKIQNQLLQYINQTYLNNKYNTLQFKTIDLIVNENKKTLQSQLASEYKYLIELDQLKFLTKVLNNELPKPKDFKLGDKIVRWLIQSPNSSNNIIKHDLVNIQHNNNDTFNLFQKYLNTESKNIKNVLPTICSDPFLNNIRHLLPILKQKVLPSLINVTNPILLCHTIYLYQILLKHLQSALIETINHGVLIQIINRLIIPYLVQQNKIKFVIDYFALNL